MDWLFAVITVASAAGCSGLEVPWQGSAAEEARELDLVREVEIVNMSVEEFAARADARAAAIDDAELIEMAETYGRLGYFDMSLDLRPIIAGSSSDWVGATYSPGSKLITLVGDARDDVLVHEFVHALQDQHFELNSYDDYSTSDSFLARRAVVEGDAVLAQYRFMVQQDGLDLDAIDWASLFDSWRSYSQDTLLTAQYPVVFLDYVSFVYGYGLEFCAANLTDVRYDDPEALTPAPHDWTLEDQLFSDRPTGSTEQVLAVDVDGTSDDAIVDVGLRAVPAELDGELMAVDWDTLGVWYTYLLLLPLDGQVVDAMGLARAWDGDTALFVRDDATDEVGVVWTSIWDDERVAADMVVALRLLHGAEEPVDGFVSPAADGEMVWLEQRGDVVVMTKNLSEAIAPTLVEAAFSGGKSAAPRRRPSLARALDRLRRVSEPIHLQPKRR